MGADGEANMEVGSSIPWDEVKVGPRPSFGPLSNTTLDPRFAYQPLPYSQDVGIDQGGTITIKGLEFTEDSAMEEAEEEHREVTATVTASQTTLQLSPDTLAIPSMSYSSPSNVRFCANVQTGPFSGGSVHLFQYTMSGNLYTLYRTASENTGFPRIGPPHEVISLFAPN